ncbi:hypothetical protein PHLGIDRAFT_126340 [Phlebiopsis gigantea 11061_1 CR5-6]|uniref:Zn(2)-C6 fungal-type domain-containing protein n=1 Tax=Phlebiopsis gigantea (strain 11061_1 CR5-6) TaxID=745531 RepID=A0A0C3SD88_PHLG1|nr:hypothetical protein PHLGIDRAFT_126340 [Phlebiopsis gigantea 11061_1 CR5-6]
MVAAANAELYTPFPHSMLIEDGVQSSEEGSTSDIHSPVFESVYPPDGHLHLPDASASFSIPSPFDARYPRHSIQVPEAHLLDTLQPPSATDVHHLLPPQPHGHVAFGLQQHPVLNLALQPPPIHPPPPALSPVGEYSFNLPQSRMSEQQMHLVAYDTAPSSSRASFSMAPPPEQHKHSPPVHISPAANGNASGSNAPSSPSRPRREASNVVIACRQCRARKIRCDSSRPQCNNCIRRGNECEYDAKPKRRGPDKRPGTRQRSCKKRPPEPEPSAAAAKKRRKLESDDDDIAFDDRGGVANGAKRHSLPLSSPVTDETSVLRMPPPPLVLDTSAQAHGLSNETIYPKAELSPIAQHSPSYMNNAVQYSLASSTIPLSPTSAMRRHRTEDQPIPRPIAFDSASSTWWEYLLSNYSGTSREESYHSIVDDLKFLFDSSSYWLFFINQPLFFDDIRYPQRRERIQPALVLSALAMSNLMRSSELERGAAGRGLALALRDSAQAALEAACNAQRIDHTLAEAAIILALFESSSHPEHSQARADASLQFVDRIVQTLSLPMIDIDDREVCSYNPRSIPIVYYPSGYAPPERCGCIRGASSPQSPSSPPTRFSFSFSYTPPWDEHAPVEERRREECRRICWSALNLVANYTAQCAAFHQEPIELSLTEPSNFCILFPGEAYERLPANCVPGQSPKDAVWALYCRSMLLWTSCVRQRDTSWTTDERADFAVQAWTESGAIQDALAMHECNLDTSIMYLAREYLYNTRMVITYELRRSLQDPDTVGAPMFSRRQAQEWLYYQEQVAQRVKQAVFELGSARGHLLTRRPFQSLWFSSQIALCIELWNYDRTQGQALDLAKTFLVPLEALDALWPCAAQRARSEEIRDRLTAACAQGGVPPPLAREVILPPILRS